MIFLLLILAKCINDESWGGFSKGPNLVAQTDFETNVTQHFEIAFYLQVKFKKVWQKGLVSKHSQVVNRPYSMAKDNINTVPYLLCICRIYFIHCTCSETENTHYMAFFYFLHKVWLWIHPISIKHTQIREFFSSIQTSHDPWQQVG